LLATVIVLSGCGGSGGGQNVPPTVVPASITVSAPAQADVNTAVALSSDLGAGREGVSFDWRFGDGAASTLAQPAHAYAAPGRYTVSLVVRATDGSSATASAVVEVFAPLHAFDLPRFTSSSTGVLSADDGSIAITTDGGLHWTRRSTPFAAAETITAVFADARNGWVYAMRHDRAMPIFRTSDGGLTWQRMADVPVRYPRQAWAADSERIVIGGSDPAVARYADAASRDGGLSWQIVPFSVVSVSRTGVMHGHSVDGVARWMSRDWGASAVQLDERHPVCTPVCVLDLDDPLALASLARLALWRSADGALTWTQTTLQLPPQGAWFEPLLLDGMRGWARGQGLQQDDPADSGLLRSDDGGVAWAPLNPTLAKPAGTRFGFQVLDAQTLVASTTDDKHWLSADSGVSWRPIAIVGEPASYIDAVKVGPGVVVVAYGRRPSPGCNALNCSFSTRLRYYLSDDAGASWRLLPVSQVSE